MIIEWRDRINISAISNDVKVCLRLIRDKLGFNKICRVLEISKPSLYGIYAVSTSRLHHV